MSKRRRRQRKQRSHQSTTPTKGSYPMPDGGVMMPEHAIRIPATHGAVDEIVIRGVRRDDPDMKLLARVLLEAAKKIRSEEQQDQVD